MIDKGIAVGCAWATVAIIGYQEPAAGVFIAIIAFFTTLVVFD